MVTNNQYETHTFKTFLDKYQVVIPKVQRDYAQGRTTEDVKRIRNRFLDAIRDCLTKQESMKLDFIYGEKEIVWSKTEPNKIERIIITPLDGQQRLTTLFLLHWFAAKKYNVPKDGYAFLHNFTYDIRPSSRDFCAHLLEYTPDFEKTFTEQLKDQNWYMGTWNDDPTVLGMLVMLDAIKEKFNRVPTLWQRLTEARTRLAFYFLTLSENGLSDELYVKMNSRGKKLTSFEHFKAEYESLYEKDSEEERAISHKFDVEWMDTFFTYRDQNDLVDNYIMGYFFYISHILCYKQGISKSNDEFELIRTLYKESPNAEDNRKFLENSFDCWYRVQKEYSSINAFFEEFLSGSHYEKGKVAIFTPHKDYFQACITQYPGKFSLPDFLFLYGIITYLINKEHIQKTDFIKRLRILRNLIWNSNSGEIRGDANYMRSLLAEVDTLMIFGKIDNTLAHGFNAYQEKEEQEKTQVINNCDLEKLHKFEDHFLIYGYASGLGYTNLDLVDTFLELFSTGTDLQKIHRAMLSVGDYRQNNAGRYYMGNGYDSTWKNLLHKSRSRMNFDETMAVFRQLLQRLKDGDTLDTVINGYLAQKEEQHSYDWRYYFVKYPEMLRGTDGELAWDESSDYLCTSLNKHQFNGQHWNPYLNVIYQRLAPVLQNSCNDRILEFGNYGDKLTILKPISSLETSPTGFVFHNQEIREEWKVEQENLIDKQDRIELAIEKLREIVCNA